METQFTEQQIRKYFASLNTELGLPSKDECAFLCPIHGDNTASASFNLDKQQWFCHACGIGGDLYKVEMLLCPEDPFPLIKQRVDAICNGENRDNTITNLPEQKPLAYKAHSPFTEDVTYYYTEPVEGQEKTIFAITRGHHQNGKKSFMAWHVKDGVKKWEMPKGCSPFPYRLSEVQDANLIFVVEGEKCVDALRAIVRTGANPKAIAVTCNPFGAGKWDDSYSQHLVGKKVIILPDNDEPGRKHAELVAESIHRVSPETDVFVGHVPTNEVGSDIADYLAAGHSITDVMAIVQNRKRWQPTVQVANGSSVNAKPTAQVVTHVPEDATPPFPEDALYGWCGYRAKELGTPIGYNYPAMLAVASLMCPSVSGTRSSLYVANIGPIGSAKTEAINRARKTIAWENDKMIVDGVPGSDRGLYKLLADTGESCLLVCDELINLMSKLKIEGSTLSAVLNTLWNHDKAGGATKQGVEQIEVKLSIVGGLVCNDPVDFQKVFGKTTTQGLTRRFIFGATNETDWCYMPKLISPDPQPMSYSVSIPDWCWGELHNWGKQTQGRQQMKEPAMRIALVTSFANHDEAITPESMQAALRFMEWQEAIRAIYKPGEAETMEAEIESIIMNVLEKVGIEVKVNWQRLYRNKHLDRKGNNLVNRVRDGLVKEGRIGFDKQTKDVWLNLLPGGNH
jgi:hypothetical protein